MKQRAPIIVAGLVLLAVVLFLVLRGGAEDSGNRFLGYMESESALVGPKTSGRLVDVEVRRGDVVKAGQPLFSLDVETAQADVREAEARLSEARAQLADRLAAEQRPQEVAVLGAARRQAAAALDLAQVEYRRQKTLFEEGWVARARLDEAEAALKRDRAGLAEVDRQIAAARLSSRSGQIEAAQSEVKAAEAALAGARTLLHERAVVAPKSGRVLDVFFRTGEVVGAGQPVLEILPPENLYVRFYVPETAVASVSPGTRLDVACDGCPDGLQAEVTFVSPEAEFTPPVIFTRDERSKLVFLVRAHPLSNPEGALKTGLPVEVALAARE
jgi:HlyD family secretion protein